MSENEWKDQVYSKLAEVFADDGETLVRVMYYLDKMEQEYLGDTPPALRTLKFSLRSDINFKTYATRLAQDTRNAETNPEFIRVMNDFWNGVLDASEDKLDPDCHQCWDLAKLSDENKLNINCSASFVRAWSIIPVTSRQQIMELIPRVIINRSVLSSMDELVSLVNKGTGTVVMVGLAAVALGYDVWLNIKRYWKGEITGLRCLKNIIDSGACLGAGMGGGVAGAAIGSAFAPGIGTLIGGVIGGIVAGQVTNVLNKSQITVEDFYTFLKLAKPQNSPLLDDINDKEVVEFYLKNTDRNDSEAIRWRIYDFIGDVIFKCTTYTFAKRYAEQSPQENNIFFYELTKSAKPPEYQEQNGISHDALSQFVFGLIILENATLPEDVKMSKEIMRLWTNFAKYGKGDRKWPELIDKNRKHNATIVKDLNPYNPNKYFYNHFEYTCDGFWKDLYS